ncbi:MAG: FIST N-terminal domain-containing protein [Polyangiaceae bacterium]
MAKLATALTDGVQSSIRAARAGVTDAKLVMLFASPKHVLADAVRAARESFPGAAVLGASSAGEFIESGDAKGAVSIAALEADVRVHTGFSDGLRQDPEAAVARALAGLPRAISGYPHCTAILLLDALSGVGEEAALLVATELGPHVKLAGGAAGDDLAMTKTIVAADGNASADAIALALVFSKEPLGVGVSHGHLPVSEPMTVTEATGAEVRTIDGRPAWDVWKERTRATAKAAGIDVDALGPSEIGAYLLRYEAGLALGSAPSAGYKIRAPLGVGADGSLSFACGIPTGAVIRITESQPERQVESAVRAAAAAHESVGHQPVAGAIIFDCICRNLILGGTFGDAVRGMAKTLGDVPLAGFETYGEIALNAGDFSGFHNTTTVALVFPKGL